MQQKATDRSTLLITWAAVTDTDLAHYELRLGDTWASGQVIDITKTLASLYQLKVSGYYRLWVATVNAAGRYSTNPTTADIQVKCEPDQPTNLAYTQDVRNAKRVILSWTPAAGQDIAGYEISRDGVVVGFATDATYTDTVSASGTYDYSIRTKTVGAFYSGYAHLTAAVMLEPLDVTNFKAVCAAVCCACSATCSPIGCIAVAGLTVAPCACPALPDPPFINAGFSPAAFICFT